jgi:hypothetical protein
MIIKSVSVGRTINLGNYESIRLDVTVESIPEYASQPVDQVAEALFKQATLQIEQERKRLGL